MNVYICYFCISCVHTCAEKKYTLKLKSELIKLDLDNYETLISYLHIKLLSSCSILKELFK